MGNCHLFGLTKTASSKNHRKSIVLLLVGLDNAGKTTTAKNLIGEPLDTVVPTVGFSSVSLTHRGYSVVIYDLGGGPQIRGIWHRYFVDVHGIIFVVDASDRSRLDEGRRVLENLLSHGKLAGKPVLLLANKQDREGALDELDIVEQLSVEAVVNQHRCPTLVEVCSAAAVKNSRRKLDPAIHNGFRWLMNCIIRDYNALNSRVENDMAVQRKQEEQEKKERLERIRKEREERGEDMAGGIATNGTCIGGMHDDSNSDIVMADPFKPIADVMEDIKRPAAPIVEMVLDSRVILVKESPKKLQSDGEEKQNPLGGGGDSNKLTGNLERFVDIDGNEVVLVASAGSRESLKSGAGEKSWFGSTVIDGQLPSPTHSVAELIKDQLELEVVQHKKRHFLCRMNRTAPAPLGPAISKCQHSLDETDLHGIRRDHEKQDKTQLVFIRKQAFVEETSLSRDSPVNLKKKQSVNKSNLFCICTDSASLEQLENSDSHLEEHKSFHGTNSAVGKNRKRPHIGELKLTNTKVHPINTEVSLSSTFSEGPFQLPVESDKVTVLKQMSSNFSGSQSNESLKELDVQVSAVPITPLAIDKTNLLKDGDINCHQLNGAEESVPEQQSCVENKSRDNSRQNSTEQGQMRLKKHSSVDETSSSGTRSQMGSQHLNDSGFVSPKNVLPPGLVSPKNVLPPIRLTSSVDKPPWILPPLSSQTKHSSQDSLLDKPDGTAATKSDVSYDPNFEVTKETGNIKSAEM